MVGGLFNLFLQGSTEIMVAPDAEYVLIVIQKTQNAVVAENVQIT